MNTIAKATWGGRFRREEDASVGELGAGATRGPFLIVELFTTASGPGISAPPAVACRGLLILSPAHPGIHSLAVLESE